MLLPLFDRLQDDPFRAIVTLIAFVISLVTAITFHEFSHALVATRLGDHTARQLGRLSLRPSAHLDPLGTAMILLAGFGWGKPVPVNPAYLRTGARPGMAVVALAGPLANILVATIVAIPLNAGLVSPERAGFTYFGGEPGEIVGYMMISLVFWNLLLATFNLIPLAPLDGFKVAVGILPGKLAVEFERLERHGPVVLLLVIMADYVFGVGILSSIIRPILNLLGSVVLGRQLL